MERIRLMLVKESTLLTIPNMPTPNLERPHHIHRWKTLRMMSRLYREQRELERIALEEIQQQGRAHATEPSTYQFMRVEVVVPLYSQLENEGFKSKTNNVTDEKPNME